MQVRLTKPEVERYIDAQVKAGRFDSPEAVVEAGVARLMSDAVVALDAETLNSIDAADDQVKRGEFQDWKQASAELRGTFLGR